MDGFSMQHITGGETVKYMHSKSQSQCGSTVCGRLRWPCQRCHVVSAEIILTSLCLWLSLEGSSQGWREACKGMWEKGYSSRRRRGWGCWASGTAGICIPLSSVAGERKVGRHGSKAQQEIWQDCDKGSGIKDAMLQDLTITPHCLASAGMEVLK